MGLFSGIAKAVGGIAKSITGGDILSAGAGLLGGAQQLSSARSNSREDRAWQERMSNTAIQRQVEDARLAGYNPLHFISKNAGASTPSGSTAQTPESAISRGVSTALQTKRLKADLDLIKKQEWKEWQIGDVASENAYSAKLENKLKKMKVDFYRKYPSLFKTKVIGEAISPSVSSAKGIKSLF